MFGVKPDPGSDPASVYLPPNPEEAATSRQPGPVAPKQRIATVDILRGFALLGILLVNMQQFNGSFVGIIAALDKPVTTLDQWAIWFVDFFAEGKFYSIFALLFGLGLALQYQRAEAQGAHFGSYWLRRMAVLLVIGLVHAYLIWTGDILILYSLLGALLLLWRKARPATLLIWTLALLLLPLLINAALWALVTLGAQSMGEAAMAEVLDEAMGGYAVQVAEADRIYATGSYIAITWQRVAEMNLVFSTLPFFAPNIFAMMMLGLYAGKRRIFEELPAHLPLIRKLWVWGLVIGVIGNFLYVYFGEQASRTMPSPQLLVSVTGQTFGAPALAIFYMTSLTLLAQRSDWQRRLAPLSYVGRMALTNYLLQSIICTLIFYGYGLGLYGKFGAAGTIVLAVAIYVLQVFFSNWWLRRFQFGPMEWLWRTLTYGRWQPMALQQIDA